MKTSITALSLLASAVWAQRPADQSICDYYTTALLMNNTAANQATLLTLVVNTAVIGNYTKPNVGVSVPGILAAGQTFNGQPVNLAQYFTGALLSSNRGGSQGVSVNFLDGGGAAPLMKNMPANSDSSNQYTLLTHLYEYFAYLLGCSQYGNTTSPYSGFTSMYQVHKFMDLGANEVGYFIEQVGMSAASFGVATADVTAVGDALTKAFDYRCSPNVSIPATAPAAPQAICIASNCMLSPNNTCAAYAPAFRPANATTGSNGTSTTPPSMNGTSAVSTSTPSTTTPSTPSSSNYAESLRPTLEFTFAALIGFAAFLL